VLENYPPILLFILVGWPLASVPSLAGGLLAPHRPDSEKLSPYGMWLRSVPKMRA